MQTYERLLAEIESKTRLRERAARDRRWNEVDRLDAAIEEAKSSYGNNFEMAHQFGKLARL